MNRYQIGVIAILALLALITMLIYQIRNKPKLPLHLSSLFANPAELAKSTAQFKAAEERRRLELKKPTTIEEAAEYLSLNDMKTLSPEFKEALHLVEGNLHVDPGGWGELLGEVYSVSTEYRDYEKAYYYYFIGLSQNGYSIGFRNEFHNSHHYLGPEGDFRNESQVADLVDVLGFESVRQIDERARKWLRVNGLSTIEFRDD